MEEDEEVDQSGGMLASPSEDSESTSVSRPRVVEQQIDLGQMTGGSLGLYSMGGEFSFGGDLGRKKRRLETEFVDDEYDD